MPAIMFKRIFDSVLILGAFAAHLIAQAPTTTQEAPVVAPKTPAAKAPAAGKPKPEKPMTDGLPPEVLKLLGMAPPEDPAAVERGTKVFVANCAFCHGSSATGGEGGPDLVRSILVLHDEKGDKIGPVILEGRPQKGMPKFPMSQAQIVDIAAFLRTQAQKKANRMAYEIQNIVTGDAKAGEAYFNGSGQCKSCHSPTGDLAGIAMKFDPVALQSRFLYPKTFTYPGMPQMGPPPPPTKVTVTLANGTSFSGTLKHSDSFSVSLYDASGEYHSWILERNPGIKVETKDPLAAHIALLPKYTDADMHNILAYLVTLK
jgi:cytochrome c oxidase cbb3-type subunit III